MKKIISICLATLMLTFFTGCSLTNNKVTEKVDDTAEDVKEKVTTEKDRITEDRDNEIDERNEAEDSRVNKELESSESISKETNDQDNLSSENVKVE